MARKRTHAAGPAGGFFSDISLAELPGTGYSAAFVTRSAAAVFREDKDQLPVRLPNGWEYMPWGADNQMPYEIIDMIERDETLSTCQLFNAEICYGSGLRYNTDAALNPTVVREVERFFLVNDMTSYFLGVCQDLKHFAFAVTVVVLSADRTRIVKIGRKEACYCRFAPADRTGRIPYLIYANWRDYATPAEDQAERIPVIEPAEMLEALEARDSDLAAPLPEKFAVVSRIPTPDSTYYPIPHYASIFRSRWYNIKQLITLAKESKLKNTSSLKYLIEVSKDYWDQLFRSEGITDPVRRRRRMAQVKQDFINFLTGAENSGKALFSTFRHGPDGEVLKDVTITRIDSSKEGGDWETDIQEAINMVCFTMRVHSNLVGSVPGKSQSNNSGSDKRELYTIAQALQKPYHDLVFMPHRVIIHFNRWDGVEPECPFIQLTTLDEHRDAREVNAQ